MAGAPRTAAVLYALVPSASPLLLSYAFYRFECSLRAAAILGIVGAAASALMARALAGLGANNHVGHIANEDGRAVRLPRHRGPHQP